MSTRSIEELLQIAIIRSAGRTDLAGFALVGPLLMAIAQMAFFHAGEVVEHDRSAQILEQLVSSPAPFAAIMIGRIVVITGIGFAAFAESWLVVRGLFGITPQILHPGVFLLGTLATIFAAGGTGLITSALFCLTRTARTFQNSITFPMFLLGGVLVPTTFLPEVLQPFTRLIYLSWAGDLLRDCFLPAPPTDVPARLLTILGLGVATGAIGLGLLTRILNKLRAEGRLGLT
jgi:ABC-2 type transport system permease protein